MFHLLHSKPAEVFPEQRSEAVTNSIKIIFKRSEFSYNQAQESPRLCERSTASSATATLAKPLASSVKCPPWSFFFLSMLLFEAAVLVFSHI